MLPFSCDMLYYILYILFFFYKITKHCLSNTNSFFGLSAYITDTVSFSSPVVNMTIRVWPNHSYHAHYTVVPRRARELGEVITGFRVKPRCAKSRFVKLLRAKQGYVTAEAHGFLSLQLHIFLDINLSHSSRVTSADFSSTPPPPYLIIFSFVLSTPRGANRVGREFRVYGRFCWLFFKLCSIYNFLFTCIMHLSHFISGHKGGMSSSFKRCDRDCSNLSGY